MAEQETQSSINTWAEATFGPVTDPVDLVKRAQAELEELLEATEEKDTSEIGKEAADIVILLHRLMGEFDLDLTDEVSAKMAINRARTWIPAGDGTGSHAKD